MPAQPTKLDPASYANFTKVYIDHMKIKYVIRFEKKVLEGVVDYDCSILEDGVQQISLDTKTTVISSLTVNGVPADYKIHTGKEEYKGNNLIVNLPKGLKKGEKCTMRIVLQTTPDANALQWLTKEQTTDKIDPIMFTYNQPIGARSIMPCMDTPSVKSTIDYEMSCPNPLICLPAAIESAPPREDADNKGYTVFTYEQKMPIPSYLIAFICGRLVSADLSERIRVWTEPSVLEKAKYEFAMTEQQLQLAESFLGKFEWRRSDMVVLPYSFPFGGMENPNMIFLTPTLLAGDRSLVHLVTHEQIHSWCGNLVTNSTWEHMWLNEGFTTYWERRIGARMSSEEHRQFKNLNAWSANLAPAVFEQYHPTHPFTALVQDHTKGGDPVSAFSMIYYEKGQVFLYHLEEVFGQKNFDRWFAQYITDFSGKSLNSEQWKEHFFNFFKDEQDLLNSVDWDAWMYGLGMPPVKPQYSTTLQQQCTEYSNLWINSTVDEARLLSTTPYQEFSTHQKIEFLNQIRNSDTVLCADKLQILEQRLGLRHASNIELENLFILTALKSHWEPIIPRAKALVETHGRLKFSRAVVRDLLAWERTQKETKELFLQIKDSMHPLGAEYVQLELNKYEM